MTVLAEGYNVFDTGKQPTGTIKYLGAPKDVIALIQSGKLKEHILLVRGGTTTFLAPALSMGAIGVVTMSGAPESHLGILSREFNVPAVMSLELSEAAIPKFNGSGLLSPEYEQLIVGALDGKQVTVDIRDEKFGFVHLAE